MPPRKEKVSVCIPAYNGARFIGEAIRSVLDQSLTDFELIVVDDCSVDSTGTIVKSFDDSRLSYFRSATRLGLAGAWNRCIELSKGKYIYIFHQDDVMMTENLAKKTEVLESNSSVGLVYSLVDVIDAEGHLNDANRYWIDQNPDTNFVEPALKFFETLVVGENPICCPSAMVRRECYETLGGFNARLPFTCDWEMWMRIALYYGVGYLAQPLIKYRWHESNETNKFLGSVRGLKQVYKAKRSALKLSAERLPNAQALTSHVTREIGEKALGTAYECYHARRYRAAKQLLAFAFSVCPALLLNGRTIRLITALTLGERGRQAVRRLQQSVTGTHKS